MNKKQERKKVIAIIQARLGSKRLPGKVLKKVLGKSLIEWIYYRLTFAKEIDGIVLATADTAENDPIVEEAKHIGLLYYRGSESDLISRYYGAAKEWNADAVVRICGDCPFVDPEVVDKLVSEYRKKSDNVDFVCNNTPPSYPHGMDVEVIPTKTLQKLDIEVDDPLYREWLTMNIVEHKEKYTIVNIEHEKNMGDMRLTVDYVEDFELTEKIMEKLHTPGSIFHLRDIEELFIQQPTLRSINKKWVSTDILDKVRKNKEFQDLKGKNNV